MNAKLITKLAPIAKKLTMTLGEHSPSIFVGVAALGVVTTVALTIKATHQAEEVIQENIYDHIDTKNYDFQNDAENANKQFKHDWRIESLKLSWKCYIPVAISASATIAAIVSGYIVQKKRISALALLYSGAIESAEKYQEKVREIVGASKDEKIRGELAQDLVNARPIDKEQIILTHHGDTLCLDALSGRLFRSDINFIKSAINNFNNELIRSSVMTLNELYQEMDLDPIGLGDYIGWNSAEIANARYDSALTSESEPCLVINFTNPPTYEYIRCY